MIIYLLIIFLLCTNSISSMIGQKNLHGNFGIVSTKSPNPWVKLEIQQNTAYTSVLEIGSNRDKVRVAVNTRMPDLWVISKNSRCIIGFSGQLPVASTDQSCKTSGTFNHDQSKSFKMDHYVPHTNIYSHNFQAAGVWGNDDVVIGSATVSGIPLGVANETTNNIGVLGLGIPSSSLQSDTNLPAELANQGIINRNAYSIYLGPKGGKGSILFGAIDHKKFSGTLKTVPIITNSSAIAVHIDKIEIVNGKSITQVSYKRNRYNLQIGTSYSIFPMKCIEAIVAVLGGRFNRNIQAYSANCSVVDSSSMRINIGDSSFDIPARTFVTARNGNNCYLTMSESDVYSFGVDILRYLYTVVDLEELKISFASINFNDAEDIEAISASNSTRRNETTTSLTSTTSHLSLHSLWKWLLITLILLWN